MEFLIKVFLFSTLFVVVCCRSLTFDSISNSSEENVYDNCSCNLKYFKHYEVKGCIVESEDSCGCPKKYSCLFKNETLNISINVCIYQNKEYQVGSKIILSNKCKVCKCYEGTPPYISCVHVDCPFVNYSSQGNNCHSIYSENKCCPIGFECVENENITETADNETFTCEYNGMLYPVGAKIYPVDDPCQICLCNKNWSGVNNISCYEHECMLESHKAKLDAGCIPVYHENKCCPIQYYCPSSNMINFPVMSENETAENNISESDEVCTFDGQFYKINSGFSSRDPCIKCSCIVPPDLTCVQYTCPPPLNYQNCYPIYNQNECCPKYDCLFGDAEPLPDGCPTPLCADSSCRIEIPPGHLCPTCVCNDRSSFLEQNTLQIQQLDQSMNTIEDEFEGPRQLVDDYSEDELQIIPIRSKETSPKLEKMILSEEGEMLQFPEESKKDNSSEEQLAVYTILEFENKTTKTRISPFLIQNKTNFESNSSVFLKSIQKRSSGFYRVMRPIQQQRVFPHVFNENSERELESSDKSQEFDDELESFRNKAFYKNKTVFNVIETEPDIVPPGCPTPMCEGPWCKIGILPGEYCPTCICKRNAEP